MFCDRLFPARVPLSGASAPEIITNSGSNTELTENIYIEACEPGAYTMKPDSLASQVRLVCTNPGF